MPHAAVLALTQPAADAAHDRPALPMPAPVVTTTIPCPPLQFPPAATMVRLMQRNIRNKFLIKKQKGLLHNDDDDLEHRQDVRLLTRRFRQVSVFCMSDNSAKKRRLASKDSDGGLMPPPPTFDPAHNDVDEFQGWMCFECFGDNLPCPMRIVHECPECQLHYCRHHLPYAKHGPCAVSLLPRSSL